MSPRLDRTFNTKAMSAPRLDALPHELLQHICDHLKERRKSLCAFSLVKKKCCAAADPLIFRKIRLVFVHTNEYCPTETSLDLTPRITRWQSILTSRGAHKYVRSLTVTQRYDRTADPLDYPDQPSHWDTMDSDDEFAEPTQRKVGPPRDRTSVPCDSETNRATWRHLRKLVNDLPALTDFMWDCTWPLSRDLQRTLQSSSKVRLHLSTFWFTSCENIDEDYVEEFVFPEEDELMSLAGHHVCSIKSRSLGYCTIGDEDWTHEAILALINGVNPGVRHVSFLMDIPLNSGNSVAWPIQQRRPRRPWPGCSAFTAISSARARLRSLEIGGDVAMSLELFQEIFCRCDLAELSVLKLYLPYTYKGLAMIAPDCLTILPRLQVLVLCTRHTAFPDSELSDQSLVAGFLGSLPPLRAIRFITDIDEPIFDSTIRWHGPSLQRLWFPPPEERSRIFFNSERLVRLSRSCPSLDDLAISIRRNRGNADEVSMYRMLGRIPRLKILALTLDCEDPALDLSPRNRDRPPIHPDFDDLDNEVLKRRSPVPGMKPRKGHLRHAFVNAALDETLAKSIFTTICSETGIRLERLELRPVRGDYIAEATDLIDHFGKWWLLECPDASRLKRRELIASRIRSPGDRDDEIRCRPELVPLSAQMETIFRKIWPARASENSAWCDDWSSFPLATD